MAGNSDPLLLVLIEILLGAGLWCVSVACETMSAMPSHLMRAVTLAMAIGSIGGALRADEPSASAGRISARMSEAILADFRKVQITPAPISEEPPVEADSDVVVMRELIVRERFDVRALNSDNLTPPTGALPLKLGTGITEYRGKKVSVLTQRILFIPLGIKLAW